MEKQSWSPKKKHVPSEIEIACEFLALRVKYMEANPGAKYPDDKLLEVLYGAPSCK